MENATKALLIAAGILFGLMIISLSLVMRNNVSNYYENQKNENIRKEIATFNGQYLIYQKDDLRGNDLLSLINKILDFNKDKADEEPEIELSILIGSTAKAQEFYYKPSEYTTRLIKLNFEYTEDNIQNEFLNEVNRIEALYTKSLSEKLSAKMDNLLESNISKQKLLDELRITDPIIDNDIIKYYQYQQFKRAHFECKATNFTETGRVQRFEVIFNGEFE